MSSTAPMTFLARARKAPRSCAARTCLALLALVYCTACSSTSASTAPSAAPFRVAVQRDIAYANSTDEAQQLDLYVPRRADESTGTRHPAVVVIHGGSWRTGGRWEMASIARALAEQGFVVANINYRLAPEHHYPAQIEDAEAAVRWLREHADAHDIDASRIGAWGYSAGAHLALLLATRNTPAQPGSTSTRLNAVVGGGTPADLLAFGESELVENFMGGTIATMPDRYRDASPMYHVSADDPPAFLYHGQDDWIVDPAQTHNLAAAFRRVGVPVVVEEPRGGHIWEYLFGRAEEREAIAFLRQQLHAGAP